MKEELSMEDKAKRYDKAIERAKKVLLDCTPEEQKVVEYISPELKESEDERIRKGLLYVIEHHPTLPIEEAEEYIAWLEKQGEDKKEINLVEILKHYPKETELYSPLYGKLWLAEVDEKNEIITCYKRLLDKGCTRAVLEQEDTISFYSNGTTGLPDFNVSKDCMLFLYNIEKQGEQKPTDKVEPKFKEGDWVTDGTSVFQIVKIESEWYIADDGERVCFDVVHQYYHLWTIKDAKVGDILFQDLMGGKTFIFDGINPEMAILYSFIINNDGEDVLPYDIGKPNTGIGHVEDVGIIYPATKEQRGFLFQKMHDAGYEWDDEKKEPKKIEQTYTNNQFTLEQASILDRHIDKFLEEKPILDKDEKIRKSLINYVHCYGDAGDFTKKEFIAWIEKQGEHANFLSKIQVGDKVTRNEAGILVNISQLNRIAKSAKRQGEQKSSDRVEPKFKVKYAGSEYNVFEVKDIAGVTYYGIKDELNHIDYVLPDNCEIVSEQKPADKVEPKFKVGDWVVDNCGYIWKIKGILNQFYLLECIEGGESRPTIEWVNKTFHLWAIQDAKDGDVLRIRNLTFIFQKITNNNVCHKDAVVAYCSYEDNDNSFGVCGPDCITDLEIITPATKEQCDLLFSSMKKAGYKWEAKKKELKKIL